MTLRRLLSRAAAPLALLLAVAACSNPGRDALNRASAVIDEHPDSAYAILTAVDPATLRNEADSALYALRWTQALYHTDREDSIVADSVLCDRLIPYAAAHYDMQPPSREHAQAFYYAGVVADMMNDNGVAIHYFQNARDASEATDTPDPILAGRIYRELGNSYGAILDDSMALKYGYLARDILVKADSAGFHATAMYDIGRTLFHLGRNEEAIAALDSIIKGDGSLRSMLVCNAMSVKARALAAMKRYGEAIPIFERLVSCSAYRMDLNDWETLGTCYAFTSQPSLAGECAAKAREIDPGSVLVEHALALAREDYRTAYGCNVAQMEAQKEYIGQLQRSLAYERTDALGHEMRLRRGKVIAESRMRSIVLAVCLVFMATVAAVIIIHLIRRSRRMLDRRLQELSKLRNQLEEAVHRSAALDGMTKDNIDFLTSVLANILKIYGKEGDMPETPARIARKRIVEASTEYFRSESFRVTILSRADIISGNLIGRLRSQVPGLTEKNLLMTALFVTGFTPEQAAVMLDIATGSVYTAKSRLMKRLEDAGTSATMEAVGILRASGHASAERNTEGQHGRP